MTRIEPEKEKRIMAELDKLHAAFSLSDIRRCWLRWFRRRKTREQLLMNKKTIETELAKLDAKP